jgi:hypothetical protein
MVCGTSQPNLPSPGTQKRPLSVLQSGSAPAGGLSGGLYRNEQNIRFYKFKLLTLQLSFSPIKVVIIRELFALIVVIPEMSNGRWRGVAIIMDMGPHPTKQKEVGKRAQKISWHVCVSVSNNRYEWVMFMLMLIRNQVCSYNRQGKMMIKTEMI